MASRRRRATAWYAAVPGYRATLDGARRHLLERFQFVDAARKVVGVGSVGTRAYIVLLQGRDQQDPLFLQVKQAAASVLEDHLPKSRYRSSGERVVRGQQLMQAASDIFLGWFSGPDGRHYYWRQLRDMKGSATVEAMSPRSLREYAKLCAWTLARAHARSGDPVAIAAFLGTSEPFDRAGHGPFSQRVRGPERTRLRGLRWGGRSGRLQSSKESDTARRRSGRRRGQGQGGCHGRRQPRSRPSDAGARCAPQGPAGTHPTIVHGGCLGY